MLIKSEKQLLNFIKYSPIIVIITITIIVNYFIYYQNKYNTEQDLKIYEKNFIDTNKTIVKAQVNKVYNDIIDEKLELQNKLKAQLKSRVYEAYQIIENIHKKFHKEGKKRVLILIKEALRNIRFNEGRGYFYLVDMKGKTILHPINTSLENKNVLKVKDIKGTYIVQDLIKNLKEKDEYFNSYYWNKPDNLNKQYKKITFNKLFKPYNIIVSSGEYLDIFTENLKKYILNNHIKRVSFSKNGYVFIFNYDGIQLSHIKKSYIGKNRINLTDANGKKITQTIINKAKEGDGFVSYIGTIIPQTGKPAEKITYVKGLSDWKWAISAGFYQKELFDYLALKEKELKRINNQYLKKTLIISLILTILLAIVAFYISKILKRFFNTYTNKIEVEVSENRKKDLILYQQAKMASMGEMIGNIAHQWRQPLNLISTAASRVKLEQEMNIITKESQEESLNAILKSTKFLSQTIDDFREFFNPNKILHNISTNTLYEKSMKLISSRFKSKDIKIEASISDFNINIYENELIQSLINILNNAIDALENKEQEEKVVFFNIELLEEYKKDEFSHIQITIKDNAGGIQEDNLSKVFDAYFTTKHQSQGTGIGLYMTYQIINKHLDGQINVKNETFTYNGKEYTGASFTIVIPIN